MEPIEANETNYKGLDQLIAELNEDKEKFSPQGEKIFDNPEPGEEFTEPITPEKAERTGERLARITDTIISNTCSIIASSDEVDKYKADERDLKDIAEAFSQLSIAKDIDLPPGVTLVVLLVMVYLPKFKIALNDRRYNRLKAQMDNIQQQIDQLTEERIRKKIELEEKPDNA